MSWHGSVRCPPWEAKHLPPPWVYRSHQENRLVLSGYVWICLRVIWGKKTIFSMPQKLPEVNLWRKLSMSIPSFPGFCVDFPDFPPKNHPLTLDTAMSGWNKGGKRRKPGRRRCSSRTPPRPRKPLPLHAGRKMMNTQGPCPISTMGTIAGHPEPRGIPRTRDSTTSLLVWWFLFMFWWSVIFWMFHQFPNDPNWCILCGGGSTRSDLFGLPPSAPAASPTASPLPWETQVPQPQQSGTSFRSSRHQAREAAAHGSLHAVVNPSHAAGTGLQGQAPMGDMLQLGESKSLVIEWRKTPSQADHAHPCTEARLDVSAAGVVSPSARSSGAIARWSRTSSAREAWSNGQWARWARWPTRFGWFLWWWLINRV